MQWWIVNCWFAFSNSQEIISIAGFLYFFWLAILYNFIRSPLCILLLFTSRLRIFRQFYICLYIIAFFILTCYSICAIPKLPRSVSLFVLIKNQFLNYIISPALYFRTNIFYFDPIISSIICFFRIVVLLTVCNLYLPFKFYQ